MPSNFYINFKYKPTSIKDENPKPVESDQMMLDMPIGTVLLRSTGEEYIKVGTNIFDKQARKILSYDEIADNYPESEGDNVFVGDNIFQGNITIENGDGHFKDNVIVDDNLNVGGTITAPTGSFTNVNVTNKITAPSGNITNLVSSSINPPGNGQGSIGTSNNRWNSIYCNNLYGNASSADYSDLAENYHTDMDYPYGTVLEFKSNELLTEYNGGTLAGVVSFEPGFKLNADEKNAQFIALKGIVPVLCDSPVAVGQFCIAVPGGKVIGKDKADMQPLDMLDLVGICYKETDESGYCIVKV